MPAKRGRPRKADKGKPAEPTPTNHVPTVAPTPAITHGEVDAICRLIDHAKAKNVRVFHGPAGLHFLFASDVKQTARPTLPKEVGDDFIP